MRDKLIKFKISFINSFKYNRQFCAYVILSLICTSVIRIVTVGDPFAWQPFFIDMALILILGSFGFLYTPQKQFSYFFIMMLLFTTIAISNAIYFSFFNSFATISMIAAAGQIGGVSDAVYDGINIFHFAYLLCPIVFFVIHRHLNNRDYFNFVAKFEKSRKLMISILAFGIVLLVLLSTTLSSTSFSRLQRQWNREYIVGKFGIVTYQLNDIVNSLRPTLVSWLGQDVAIRKFIEYFEANPAVVSNNSYTGRFEGKNIVFIHMESMTTFLVDLEINGVEIAPNLNRLTREGIYFPNYYPQIGVGTSSDSEFTLLASLLPPVRGTAFVSYFDRTYNTIPWALRNMGYYTFSMHGNRASMWNRNIIHPRLGYVDFYSSTSFNIDEVIGLGISDRSFFRQAIPILEEIEQNNESYMGTIITLTNHTPFEFNEEHFLNLELTYTNPEGITYDYLSGTKLGEYIISANYADIAIGEFIQAVEASEYFNNTIFVFYGDHDPRLALREYYNFLNFDSETGETFDSTSENYIPYDNISHEINRRTPFIIWSPNEQFNLKYDYPLGSIDVMPTIGNMFGFSNEYALGNDIFEVKNDNMIIFPNGNFLTSQVFFHSTRESYRVFNTDEMLAEDYISSCKERAELLLDLSDSIVVHDIIRRVKEAEANKETPENEELKE